MTVLGYDPVADPDELAGLQANCSIVGDEALEGLDGVVIAVAHRAFMARGVESIARFVKPGAVVLDIKGLFSQGDFPNHNYWCL